MREHSVEVISLTGHETYKPTKSVNINSSQLVGNMHGVYMNVCARMCMGEGIYMQMLLLLGAL